MPLSAPRHPPGGALFDFKIFRTIHGRAETRSILVQNISPWIISRFCFFLPPNSNVGRDQQQASKPFLDG